MSMDQNDCPRLSPQIVFCFVSEDPTNKNENHTSMTLCSGVVASLFGAKATSEKGAESAETDL